MPPDQQVHKRAILYARTSADSENEGLKLSIEEQLDACKNLAPSHGYQIIGEYFYRNRSGRTYPTGSIKWRLENRGACEENDFRGLSANVAS